GDRRQAGGSRLDPGRRRGRGPDHPGPRTGRGDRGAVRGRRRRGRPGRAGRRRRRPSGRRGNLDLASRAHRSTASPILRLVPERLPLPGPSFLREREVRAGDRTYLLGMARPTDGPDGWWLAILWVADGESVIPFRDLAPDAGPPP